MSAYSGRLRLSELSRQGGQCLSNPQGSLFAREAFGDCTDEVPG